MDLRDASIALIGRLGRLPRRRLALSFKEFNLSVTRRVSSRSTVVVIGQGAVALLRSGKLDDILARADTRHLPVISEHGFLRDLGLLPALPAEPRTHSLRDLAARAALSVETVRLLALFDIIEDSEGHYSFRDLKAARDFARALNHRDDLAGALDTALQARRRHEFRRHLAEVPLTGSDSQMPLDLGDEAETFDSLWQAAQEAEADHDDSAAEQGYRRCVAMRPRDPLALLHLAAVVAAQERPDEARALLSRALAIKPDFAEAWFHLALLESDGAAKDCLERAINADPDHVEAIHELAQMDMQNGLYDDALPLWERYLALIAKAPNGQERQAVEHAKRALTLCRMARLRPNANGTPTR